MNLRDYLALRLGGAFRSAYGLTVIVPPGILIDQTEVGRRVEKVRRAFLGMGHHVSALFSRVTLRLSSMQPIKGVNADARWLGGLLDRGEIRVKATETWADDFESGLAALVSVEIGVTLPEEV